jgi:TrmH family RNA methyltransferase
MRDSGTDDSSMGRRLSSPSPPGAAAITAVLVRTHSPGNLGSAARVVANFGATLALVDPRTGVDHPEAIAHASGADAILGSAQHFSDLDEVASRFDLLVALSSERGRTGRSLPPRIGVAALRRALAAGRPLALLFGPERSGLSTEELLRCDARWSLPTEPSFPTLNLAQAVAVSLALLRGTRTGATRRESTGDPIRRETWQHLLSEARRILEARFPVRRARPDVVDELVACLRRAHPTEREARLLLAALAGAEPAPREPAPAQQPTRRG